MISKSKEKIKYFPYGPFVFTDTYNHLTASLDSLVETLTKSGHDFEIAQRVGLPKCLWSKGVYPYKWVDSIMKFDETSLPPIDYFHNDLTGEKCTLERYQKAQQVWKELGCKTFKDYHMGYLFADVILLAEVYTNYRKECMSQFGLDPARFVSVQSMTLTNWLKHISKPVGVLSDKEMYDFFRSAIRGGMCNVGEITYANVYGRKGEYIIGLDMNALYPTAMLFPLPSDEFQWVDPKEAEKVLCTYDINQSEYGYMIECNIEVPDTIHDMVSAYPLLPEMIECKLKATLYNKIHYIDHIVCLQLGISLGYRITKIDRAVKFKQTPVMRDYIMMLAQERRKEASQGDTQERAVQVDG
jgi:hypothetical protein